jgi:glycosyltransferase involved in cell wall biosynthesis
MKPLVSVIMPAYNQAAFLPEALTSILTQSYPHLEIILVDDGSIDSTPEICRSLQANDLRFHYFQQPNQGPSAARNHAISYSQGDYICLLDADDRMEERKIELQISTLLADPKIDIVYTALYIMDINSQRIGEIKSRDYAPHDFLAHMFFRNIIPNPNTIMAKRECLVSHSYNEQFKHAEDYELMMRLAHQYHFKYLDLPLTSYRRHSSNLSNNLQAHRQAEIKVLSQYSKEHVKEVVDQSSLKEEEKILLKGKILFNMEFFTDALAIFQGLDSTIAYFYSGNCYLKLNQVDQAIRSYQCALDLDQTNAACYNNLGAAYILSKKSDLAKELFQKALLLNKHYLDAKYNLDHCYLDFFPKITGRELRVDLLPYSNF